VIKLYHTNKKKNREGGDLSVQNCALSCILRFPFIVGVSRPVWSISLVVKQWTGVPEVASLIPAHHPIIIGDICWFFPGKMLLCISV